MDGVYKAYRRDNSEPVDFIVAWSNPEDAFQVWQWNAEHSPFPVTPLSAEFANRIRDSAGRVLSPRLRPAIYANGYMYMATQAGTGKTSIEGAELDDLLARIDEIWENGWRARIERESNEVAYADYDSLSLREVVRCMERARDQLAAQRVLVFRALDIVSSAVDKLTLFLRRALGAEADVEGMVSELLQGQWTTNLAANSALWDIAQIARRSPQLRDALEKSHPKDLLEGLNGLEGAADFVHALTEWLERYGRRSGQYAELIEPTWKDDPSPVVILLQGYLEREDPRAAFIRAKARREAVAEEIRAQLSDAERPVFEKLLANVASYLPVRESRNSVMSLSRSSLRAPVLAAARKLVALSAITDKDDIFFLTFAEIEALGEGPKQGTEALIEKRRAEHEFRRNVVPPATVGGHPVNAAAVVGRVKGVGASRGKARGKARVILNLSEGDRLQPGEILVTRSTTSAWTPLFLNAAGIVTDSGGMLSHCAVVAREYQLPAVVGTYTATRVIADGDILVVDGDTGLVTIELE